MATARFVKALAAVALFNGVLFLCVCEEALAANNEADAKKYTKDLKKGKDAKVKITALQELGKLAAIQKSLVANALPEIYKALEDKDAGVRAAAAKCLGACDEPADKAVPAPPEDAQGRQGGFGEDRSRKGLASMGPKAKSPCRRCENRRRQEDKVGKLAKAASRRSHGRD